MARLINLGCGLYMLFLAFSLYRLLHWPIPVPHPNEGPLPDPWLALVSPFVVAAIGLVSVAVNVMAPKRVAQV